MSETIPSEIESLTTLLREAGVDPATLAVDARGTLFVSSTAATTPRAPRDGSSVPFSGVSGEVVLKERLARGGHGDVYAGFQASLEREVAVKRAKRGTHDESESTVAEARLVGSLEHPNIVPVHLVSVDDDENPLIVMKRITGSSWHQILESRASTSVDVEKNVEILIRVCDAMRFAHDRGVLHLDLKPANVMVGEFGEVYLLDWGIARAFGDKGPTTVPRVDEERGPLGTPAYMAPEQVSPKGVLDVRTDVFLLGGVLYSIMTGRPLYEGDNLQLLMFAAYTARPPVFGDDAPEELVEICRKALARDPLDRFASVAEFQAALRGFLEHTAARALIDRANQSLGTLEPLLGSADPDVDRRELTRLFNEARFGFSQALNAWPSSGEARRGLVRAVTAMARYELNQGHVDAAELLVSELALPPPDLVADIEKGRAAQKAEIDWLRFRARDTDSRVGRRTRANVLGVIGVLSALTLAVIGTLDAQGILKIDHATSVVRHTFLVIVGSVGVYLARGTMLSTKLNRVITTSLMTALIGVLCLWLASWRLQLSIPATFALIHLVLGIVGITAAANDPRLWAGAVSFLVGSAVIAFFPSHFLVLDAMSLVTSISLYVWRLRRIERSSRPPS